MTANPHRGEVEVRLGRPCGAGGGQRPYLLRPTFAGLAMMEAASGAGLMALARRFATGKAGFIDTASVIAGGLEGGSAGGLSHLLAESPGPEAAGPAAPRDSPHDSAATDARGWAWQRVAALVFETGFLGLMAPASTLLWHAVKGDEEFAAAGEARAGNG